MQAPALPIEFNCDVDKWISLFPFENEPENPIGGTTIIGPESLAYVIQARRLFFRSDDIAVPADIFVFGVGEPPRRDSTKVGGLPYRPVGKPWPETPQGVPMTFLAQYRFVESKDILPELLGDIMLVFLNERHCDDFPTFQFEWYFISPEDELIAPEDVPAPRGEFISCYGVRLRTIEYVNLEEANRRLIHSLSEDTWQIREAIKRLCWLDGMKIGGMPCWHELDGSSPKRVGDFGPFFRFPGACR